MHPPAQTARRAGVALRTALLLTALLSMLGGPGAPLSASSRSQGLLAAATLEAAVESATQAAAPTSEGDRIVISPIAEVSAWTFGTSGIIPAQGSEAEPRILLFLAEQGSSGWAVAMEHTRAFGEALRRAPDGLLSDDQRKMLEASPQLQGNGSMQLSLPWATGETQYFTGGPHGTTRAAIDFSGGSGIVRAAREGVAYVPCGTASDYVRIDHGGGLTTNYYHLAGISVGNGQSVARGAPLGRQSTSARCLGGSATGNHVHFWISQNGADVAINGIDIGGWTVSNGASEYQGCLTRVRDGLRRCTPPYQAIANEGMVGSGLKPSQMDVNQPGSGATVNGTIVIGGWAIHEAAASGTGVDTIHFYFDGPAGAGREGSLPPTGCGATTLRQSLATATASPGTSCRSTRPS